MAYAGPRYGWGMTRNNTARLLHPSYLSKSWEIQTGRSFGGILLRPVKRTVVINKNLLKCLYKIIYYNRKKGVKIGVEIIQKAREKVMNH